MSVLEGFFYEWLFSRVVEELFEAFLELLFTNFDLFKDFFNDGLQAFFIIPLHEDHDVPVGLHVVVFEGLSASGHVVPLLFGELDSVPDNGCSVHLQERLERQQVADLLEFGGQQVLLDVFVHEVVLVLPVALRPIRAAEHAGA